MDSQNVISHPKQTNALPRVRELDFLKGILILLVIAFHLVYFSTLYPYAKQVVYTFHMPAFLLLSGYLMNFEKGTRGVLRTLLWLVVPYVVMESSYIIMASILPIREHIETLTLGVFIDKLLLHPIGPYWYLQTIVICGALWYALRRWTVWKVTTKVLGIPVRALLYIFIALLLGVEEVVTPACAMYFLGGVLLRNFNVSLVRFFEGGWVALLMFACLITNVAYLDKATPMGILIVYTFVGACFFLYRYLPSAVQRLMEFLGRNSLVLYLFSPIFTILCKYLVPFLSFDPSGILFLVLSLIVCVVGCLAIAKILEFIGISRYMFGRGKVIV